MKIIVLFLTTIALNIGLSPEELRREKEQVDFSRKRCEDFGPDAIFSATPSYSFTYTFSDLGVFYSENYVSIDLRCIRLVPKEKAEEVDDSTA